MQSDDRFSDVLSEFARTLLTDFPIQAILDHLVKRIVDVLPISAAGVTLISPTTEPHFVAASDASAMRFEQLQTELGSGPCIAAYQTGAAVSVPDITHEDRFPEFTQRAVAAGLVAVFTFPLRDGDRRLGALDLYASETGALDERAMASAQTLADVATAYLLNAQARVDLQAASHAARETSMHDGLTGLPNRTLLVELLQNALAKSRRSGTLVGVLFVDLDRFKQINDSFGHQIGDELLIATARRITMFLRPGDTLARLSGDEFVIVCEGLQTEPQGHRVAARVEKAFAKPFKLSVTEVLMTASIGVTFAHVAVRVPVQKRRGRHTHHVDVQAAEQLLREADIAMYQVKRSGGASRGTVDPQELGRSKHRIDLGNDLRRAMSLDQLHVEYQPIVSVTSGRAVGAEALARWVHPTMGPIAPEVFIPLAEQTGLIVTIGRMVLEQACRDRERLTGSGDDEPFAIAINVSPHQLTTPDFVRTVETILDATHTPPDVITLEVTETALIQDRERARVVLGSLRDLGVKLALDDFGTGSSSLSHLLDFSVNIVKIDRAFVAEVETDSASRYIVEAIITLAHRLGLTVIAEGVETRRQHDSVQDLGCDLYQGFFFSPSVPVDAFDAVSERL